MFFHQFRAVDLYIIVIDALKGKVFRTPVKEIFVSNLCLWALLLFYLTQVKMKRRLLVVSIRLAVDGCFNTWLLTGLIRFSLNAAVLQRVCVWINVPQHFLLALGGIRLDWARKSSGTPPYIQQVLLNTHSILWATEMGLFRVCCWSQISSASEIRIERWRGNCCKRSSGCLSKREAPLRSVPKGTVDLCNNIKHDNTQQLSVIC